MFSIQKNQKNKRKGATSTYFPVSDFFQIQNIYLFTFENVQKLPKINEHQ